MCDKRDDVRGNERKEEGEKKKRKQKRKSVPCGKCQKKEEENFNTFSVIKTIIRGGTEEKKEKETENRGGERKIPSGRTPLAKKIMNVR